MGFFSNTFLDCFFPQELKEVKMKEFVNLKQGKMSVMEYALSFISCQSMLLILVADMRAKMRKFIFGLS